MTITDNVVLRTERKTSFDRKGNEQAMSTKRCYGPLEHNTLFQTYSWLHQEQSQRKSQIAVGRAIEDAKFAKAQTEELTSLLAEQGRDYLKILEDT